MPNNNFHNLWIKLTDSQKNQLNKSKPISEPKLIPKPKTKTNPKPNPNQQMLRFYRCKNRIIVLPFGLK
jgi:hypothetical protein